MANIESTTSTSSAEASSRVVSDAVDKSLKKAGAAGERKDSFLVVEEHIETKHLPVASDQDEDSCPEIDEDNSLIVTCGTLIIKPQGSDSDKLKIPPLNKKEEEISEALMAPGWNIWTNIFIVSAIGLVFQLFAFMYVYNVTYGIILNPNLIHFQVLYYEMKGFYKYIPIAGNMSLISILFILYNHGSNLYESGYWLDRISITNFVNCEFCEILILILFLGFNFSVYKIIQIMNKKPTNMELSDDSQRKMHRKWSRIGFLVTYIVCFLINCTLLFLYILFLFTPKDNYILKHLPEGAGDRLNLVFPLLQSLFTNMAAPFLLSHFGLKKKYENAIQLTSLFLIIFILPLILIFVLSHNCLNFWLTFWDPCVTNLSESMGVESTFDIVQNKFPYTNLLSHDSICRFKAIDDIRGTCTRDVFRIITNLSVQSLFYKTFVIQVLMLAFESIKFLDHKHGFLPTQISSIFKFKKNDDSFFTGLYIDCMYVIMFGFGCPLICVLIFLAFISHLIHYGIRVILFQKNMMFGDHRYSSKILYLCLLSNHLLGLYFWRSNDFYLDTLLILIIVFCWIYLAWKTSINKELVFPSWDKNVENNDQYMKSDSEFEGTKLDTLGGSVIPKDSFETDKQNKSEVIGEYSINCRFFSCITSENSCHSDLEEPDKNRSSFIDVEEKDQNTDISEMQEENKRDEDTSCFSEFLEPSDFIQIISDSHGTGSEIFTNLDTASIQLSSMVPSCSSSTSIKDADLLE